MVVYLGDWMMERLSCVCVLIIPLVDRTEEFEAFFTAQPFFRNLRFIHGDKLFDFDKGIGYRNLTVQVGYVCFCKGDGEFVLND